MNIFKKIYCRTMMVIFYSFKPFLPYRVPKTIESIGDIAPLLKGSNKSSVLLVTDKSIRALGLTAALEKQLQAANICLAVYDGTCPNPTVANVEEGAALYTANACEAMIAFGGGSAMDCAKAIGARIVKPKKPIRKMAGTLKVRKKIPTVIAIPTTAGTGAEATPAAVITDRETGRKYTVNDFCLSPQYAVLDPTVTYSLPPHLTATTGLDALTHAVESYVGHSTTKKTRAQSLESARLILENIETAYEDGRNYEARANMLKASYLAGMAFSMAYVGYVHAIAHTLGGTYNVPHGLANSVLLPVILEGYGKSAYKKLQKLALYCGLAKKTDSREIAAKKFIARIWELNEKMNIPKTIKGIRKEDIPTMAKYADHEANPLYAVPTLWNAKELAPYYEKVAEGE